MLKRISIWVLALVLVAPIGCVTTPAMKGEAGATGMGGRGEDHRALGPGGEHHVDAAWTEEEARSTDELAAAFHLARGHSDAAAELHAAPRAASVAEGAYLLQIYVFNIGQADSMLAVGPAGKTLLIDLGKPGGGEKPPGFDSSRAHVLDRLEDITGNTHVDYFIASHYHGDHLGSAAGPSRDWGHGIIGLLSDFSVDFSVGEFIHIGGDGAEYMKSEDRRSAYKAIQERMPLWKQYDRVENDGPPQFGTDQIDLGSNVTIDVLAFAGRVPNGSSAFEKAENEGIDYSDTPGNENDLSIALEISAGEFELFTAGDLNGTDDPESHPFYVRRPWGEIYTNVEHHLANYWETSGRESDVEIYRADHHGSGYSNTRKLLDALDPEFILYSTGAQYGHPTPAALQRGAETARQFATTAVTDEGVFEDSRGELVGEIAILVALDGKSYTINGEQHEAFSDAAEEADADEGEEDRVH